MNYPIVPVLMFHMVNNKKGELPLNWLVTPVETFEKYLKVLQRDHYVTITLKELYEYLIGLRSLPEKSVVLTFDDGYLDNWVNVYPLLKKYGMRAVVWISQDFVETGRNCRPIMQENQKNQPKQANPEDIGYLNENEIVEMDRSGIFEIGCHCKTHTRIFTSNKVIDFHKHGHWSNYWLAWNQNPSAKQNWIINDPSYSIPQGLPIYEHGLATCERQYFPDSRLITHILNKYNDIKGKKMDWKRQRESLFKEVDLWRKKNLENGYYETDQQMTNRIKEEITSPKEYLEGLLGHSVEFLCWPGGGSSKLGIRLAEEAGFLATTIRSSLNQYGKNPKMIDRICIPFLDKPFRFLNNIIFQYELKRYRFEAPFIWFWLIRKISNPQLIAKPVEFGKVDME